MAEGKEPTTPRAASGRGSSRHSSRHSGGSGSRRGSSPRGGAAESKSDAVSDAPPDDGPAQAGPGAAASSAEPPTVPALPLPPPALEALAAASQGRKAACRTVLGDVPPQALGTVLAHEHLAVDYGANFGPPQAGTARAALGGLSLAQARSMWSRPMEAAIAGHCRSYVNANRDNMALDDADAVVEELEPFSDLTAPDGGTVVECSVHGIGRDVGALVTISQRARVHVVMGTGLYMARVHPKHMRGWDVSRLTDLMVREIEEGVPVPPLAVPPPPEGASDVDSDDEEGQAALKRAAERRAELQSLAEARPRLAKAGIIGELGCSNVLEEGERRVLQAAAAASRATGAAIAVHPGHDAESPRRVLDVLARAGADLRRVVVAHCDRGALSFKQLCALAERGAVLGFDQFGWPPSFTHAIAYGIVMPSDFERVALVRRLVAAGFGDRIVLSHDIGCKARLHRFGGLGFDYLLRCIVPYMLSAGVEQADIDAMLVHTPARLLTLAPARPPYEAPSARSVGVGSDMSVGSAAPTRRSDAGSDGKNGGGDGAQSRGSTARSSGSRKSRPDAGTQTAPPESKEGGGGERARDSARGSDAGSAKGSARNGARGSARDSARDSRRGSGDGSARGSKPGSARGSQRGSARGSARGTARGSEHGGKPGTARSAGGGGGGDKSARSGGTGGAGGDGDARNGDRAAAIGGDSRRSGRGTERGGRPPPAR